MPERPFICEDTSGRVLRGVLTEPPPDVAGRDLGLVLLPAGLLPRCGYHRHYVKGARLLASAGVTTLRIDLPGLGDAEGELAEGPVEQRWREVQLGCFVSPALAAVRALREQTGCRRVVLGGACGGAITALLAAARAPELVSGCLAISLPVCLSGSLARATARAAAKSTAVEPPAGPVEPGHPGDTPALHPRRAAQLLRQHLHKLLSPRAWYRMLSGQSELGEATRAVATLARRWSDDLLRRLAPFRAAAMPDDGRPNPEFLPAFRKVTACSLPLLVVLGEQDPDADDFHRYFELPVLGREPELRRRFQLEVFAHADHTFANPEDEQQLWQRTLDWLLQAVPGGRT